MYIVVIDRLGKQHEYCGAEIVKNVGDTQSVMIEHCHNGNPDDVRRVTFISPTSIEEIKERW